jgi:hypothetical protein
MTQGAMTSESRARSVKSNMSRMRRNLIVALGVAALTVPAAAVAHHKEGHTKGQGQSKPHNVAYVFKGTYAGESTVAVTKGNSRVRKGGFVGTTVAFDLADARIVVADTNSDLTSDLSDVQVGDKVLVKAMLPKKEPGSQPFDADKLVDQTHPPAV